MTTTYTPKEVEAWNVHSLVGFLKVTGISTSVLEFFLDNDITGEQFLQLNAEAMAEMNMSSADSDKLSTALKAIMANAGKEASTDPTPWHSDSEDEEGGPESAAPAQPTVAASQSIRKSKIDAKNDPLRLAAQSKAVSDLEHCTVTAGYLWKTGSGKYLKNWKRRYFVLTDDNCLYYFKSPKEMAALGMILLPSYTITKTDKSDGVGSRQFTFKAFNREHPEARTYIFAAEDERDMRTWMNVMSLASIAFGSGKASTMRTDKPASLFDEHSAEVEVLQKRAADRAGGVEADSSASVSASRQASSHTLSLPSFLKGKSSSKGRTLVLIKLLDGETMQLFAEPATYGAELLDQVCTVLNIFEKYYFGLCYYDTKSDMDWVSLEKKVLKQDIPRVEDHIVLEFKIRFYPSDVTQVIQYATLYQTFLTARQGVLLGNLEMNNRDVFMLAAFSLQAIFGDYDAARDTPSKIATTQLIPEMNKEDIIKTSQLDVHNVSEFFAEEVIRVWKTLRGILRHLAVLKYVQIVQKHRQFAMTRFDIKNKAGTPLVLGVNPKGLFTFRLNNMLKPVVSFSWAECAELCFTEKKFTVELHDKTIPPFTVYTTRSKISNRILDLCIGLHRLYLLRSTNFKTAPPEMQELRQLAINAATIERKELTAAAAEARKRAKELRAASQPAEVAPEPVAEAPAEPTADTSAEPVAEATPEPEAAVPEKEVIQSDSGEEVHIKGRQQAVAMLDMMMNDADFMRFQDEFMADFEAEMMEELNQGGRLRATSFAGGKRPSRQASAMPEEEVDVCETDNLNDRVQYLDKIHEA
eukprot:m.40372 g.40372  ORF g.40372 m.40372 type:complete len:809 (+) comp10434_c1_seq1:87-2513(+)